MKRVELIALLEEFNASVAIKQGREYFVGAVYDGASSEDAIGSALIVGINYGQEETSKKAFKESGTTGEETVYATEECVGYSRHATELGGGKSFHTVLWNF